MVDSLELEQMLPDPPSKLVSPIKLRFLSFVSPYKIVSDNHMKVKTNKLLCFLLSLVGKSRLLQNISFCFIMKHGGSGTLASQSVYF